MLTAICVATDGAAQAPLDDPRVQEVLTMARGGLSSSLILAEVEDIGAFPELAANDLVALKEAGVPGEALVRMIELEEAAAASPVTVAPPPEATPEDPSATASVRIELDLEPGEHEVAVAFAVSLVEDDAEGHGWTRGGVPSTLQATPGVTRR